MKEIIIALLMAGGVFGICQSAQAAIWPISLNQDSITADLSQDVGIQIIQTDYTGERLFAEFNQTGNTISVKVFPSSAKTNFVLLSENSQLISSNPQYTFKTQLQAPLLVTPPPQLAQAVVNQKYDKLLYQDNEIIVGADVAVNGLKVSKNLITYVNDNDGEQVSKAYDLSFSQGSSVPLKLNLRYNDNRSLHKVAYYFDYSTLTWIALPSYNDIDQSRVYFELNQARARVAIFGDSNSFDGKASWYDQSRYKNFNYKNGFFAAHRDYPKGTEIEVTRLKTGEKTTVVVNDWGPQAATGRLIDLEKQAFGAIASLGAGEVYVNIRVINDKAK